MGDHVCEHSGTRVHREGRDGRCVFCHQAVTPVTSEDFEKGMAVGIAEHANGMLNLSDPELTKVWADASPEWKRGWSTGWEEAASAPKV